jgi:hypothetical protein
MDIYPVHTSGVLAPVTWAWTEVWDEAKIAIFRTSRVRKILFMFLIGMRLVLALKWIGFRTTGIVLTYAT